MANSSIAVYDRSLTLVSSATLAAFIGVAPSVFLCDPQIQWVPSANRWLYSFLYCNNTAGNQAFAFGWSKTSDPTTLGSTGWCQFAYPTGSPLFDYMKLGHNSNYLIVGGNFYANPTTPNPSFIGSAIYWAPLPPSGPANCALPAVAGTTAAPLKNGDGVSYTFTPVPVNSYTSASDGYIVSAYTPLSLPTPGPRAKVAVWHLDSAGVLRADNDVAVNSYNVPSFAPQLGTTNVLDTLDAQLTQAVGDPTAGFYTQHTVAGPGGRSEVHWYQFTVSGSTVALAQQGSISSPTDWVFNAAISPRFDGLGAAIVYNRSSSSIYPVIAAQIRFQSTTVGTWAAGELVLASSAAADTDHSCNVPAGSPCRWGDYAATTPDPVQTNVVWGTSEFNTASGLTAAWSNQNFALAPTPEAPTNVRASALRTNAATISWTPGASDPATPPTNYTVTPYIGGTAGAPMTTVGPVTTLTFTGLTIGVTYTFTVIANSVVGPSLESARSNAVVIGDGALQSAPAPVPPRQPVLQSTPAPVPPGR